MRKNKGSSITKLPPPPLKVRPKLPLTYVQVIILKTTTDTTTLKFLRLFLQTTCRMLKAIVTFRGGSTKRTLWIKIYLSKIHFITTEKYTNCDQTCIIVHKYFLNISLLRLPVSYFNRISIFFSLSSLYNHSSEFTVAQGIIVLVECDIFFFY